MLVNVPCFVAQVQHHAVGNGLVELVGVNVGAKDLYGLFLVLFHQRRASKADEHSAGQQLFHCLMQPAGLSAMALVYKNEQVAFGAEVLGQAVAQLCNECSRALLAFIVLLPAKLMHQRAHQPGRRLIQGMHKIGATLGAVDCFAHPVKYLLYLLVQLFAVGDNQHSGVGNVLPNPLGQPHHGQAFAGALRVPDNAALAPINMAFTGLHAKKLIVPAGFFDAGVKHNKIVNQLQKTVFAAQATQVVVQQILSRVVTALLPLQVVLF